MTFKKDGTDPELSRGPILPGLPGGQDWPSWLHQAALAAQKLIQAALGVKPTPKKRHRNMLHVSKRIRRKHRRAA